MLGTTRFKILTLAGFFLALVGFGYVLYQSIYGWNLDRRVRHQAVQTARDVYQMCRAAQSAIHKSLLEKLREALAEIDLAGSVRLERTELISWPLQQPSAGAATVSLPTLTIGETRLKPGLQEWQLPPLLARLGKATGGEVALYQRISPTGDLFRIFSNVAGSEEWGYPGEVLPENDPLASRLVGGEPVLFPGRSDGAWVMVAMVPLREASGEEVIGALQVSLPCEELEHLVRRIMGALIGRDGYVFVLGANGELRGRYLISKDGLRDGENIWNSLDATGRPFIQSIIVQALALAETAGERAPQFAFERYPWQNPGEQSPRYKSVAITYFEPWDWVIGAGYYEDEF